jgi:hypothetical protein
MPYRPQSLRQARSQHHPSTCLASAVHHPQLPNPKPSPGSHPSRLQCIPAAMAVILYGTQYGISSHNETRQTLDPMSREHDITNATHSIALSLANARLDPMSGICVTNVMRVTPSVRSAISQAKHSGLTLRLHCKSFALLALRSPF